MTNLYIFDKDGTICESRNGNTFVNSVNDQILKPNVKGITQKLKNEGNILAIASNQGGVSFGYLTVGTALRIVSHAAYLIGAEYYQCCVHHPKGTNEYAMECPYRKPNPGMILELIRVVKPDKTIFIGDRLEDKLAAKRANVEFFWADEFFIRGWKFWGV